MLAELATPYNVDTKRNSKGHTTSWIDYKLPIDVADSGIPISCLLISTPLHNGRAVIPPAEISQGRVTNLYDMMDSVYDVPQIKAYNHALGHAPNGT